MTLTEIVDQNRIRFEKGDYNYIPIMPLGQFTEWFPGFMKGDVTAITGTPASSKTAFSKLIVEHSSIPWAINEKKNLKILRFGLEESQKQYWFSLLSYRMWVDHKLEYNIKDFMGIGRAVKEQHIPLIKEAEAKVERMKKYIIYEDSTFNSFGIWKRIRTLAQERGTFYGPNNKPLTSLENGWSYYKPNDPEEYVMVVTDNLSYIRKDSKEKDKAEAIWNTVEYQRDSAANKLDYSVLFLHHQYADTENQDNRREKTILPTESGLATNKEVSRAYLNLIGIANPNKANTAGVENAIRSWDGHSMKEWQNYLRTVNIIKGRYGEANCHTNLAFFGRSGFFEKIPELNSSAYKEFVANLKNFK
jgi:hypothetical protein